MDSLDYNQVFYSTLVGYKQGRSQKNKNVGGNIINLITILIFYFKFK